MTTLLCLHDSSYGFIAKYWVLYHSQDDGIISKQSDIYTFGVVLYDMVSLDKGGQRAGDSLGSEAAVSGSSSSAPAIQAPHVASSFSPAEILPQEQMASASVFYSLPPTLSFVTDRRQPLPLPSCCGPELMVLIEECLQRNPSERPCAAELLRRLTGLLDRVCASAPALPSM